MEGTCLMAHSSNFVIPWSKKCDMRLSGEAISRNPLNNHFYKGHAPKCGEIFDDRTLSKFE
jgi:hypothetical protein